MRRFPLPDLLRLESLVESVEALRMLLGRRPRREGQGPIEASLKGGEG